MVARMKITATPRGQKPTPVPRPAPAPSRKMARAHELEECGRRLAALLEEYDATLEVTRQETVGPLGAPVITYLIRQVGR